MGFKLPDYNTTTVDLGRNLGSKGYYYMVQIYKMAWLSGRIGSYSVTGPSAR